MGWLTTAWTVIVAGLLGMTSLAPRTAPPLVAKDYAAACECAPQAPVPAVRAARTSPAPAARAVVSGGPIQIAATARLSAPTAARFAALVVRSQLHPPRPRVSPDVSERGPPPSRA